MLARDVTVVWIAIFVIFAIFCGKSAFIFQSVVIRSHNYYRLITFPTNAPGRKESI